MYGLVEATLLGCPIILPPHFGMMNVRSTRCKMSHLLQGSLLIVSNSRQNFFFAGANKHVCAEQMFLFVSGSLICEPYVHACVRNGWQVLAYELRTLQVGCEVNRPGGAKRGYLYCHEARYHHDSKLRLCIWTNGAQHTDYAIMRFCVDFAALTQPPRITSTVWVRRSVMPWGVQIFLY